MNTEAYDGLTGVIDDAISLAADAVEAAELAEKQAASETPEPATLVKVASHRYVNAAKELMKTGAFRGETVESLSKSLEEAGPAEFLGFMEKLASRAVFPIDVDLTLDGELVEKSTADRDAIASGQGESNHWFDACSEAGIV